MHNVQSSTTFLCALAFKDTWEIHSLLAILLRHHLVSSNTNFIIFLKLNFCFNLKVSLLLLTLAIRRLVVQMLNAEMASAHACLSSKEIHTLVAALNV
jgi:hypothetical protein